MFRSRLALKLTLLIVVVLIVGFGALTLLTIQRTFKNVSVPLSVCRVIPPGIYDRGERAEGPVRSVWRRGSLGHATTSVNVRCGQTVR